MKLWFDTFLECGVGETHEEGYCLHVQWNNLCSLIWQLVKSNSHSQSITQGERNGKHHMFTMCVQPVTSSPLVEKSNSPLFIRLSEKTAEGSSQQGGRAEMFPSLFARVVTLTMQGLIPVTTQTEDGSIASDKILHTVRDRAKNRLFGVHFNIDHVGGHC